MFVKLKGGLLNLDDVHEIRPGVSEEFNSYVIFKASAPRRGSFLIDTVEEIQEARRSISILFGPDFNPRFLPD